MHLCVNVRVCSCLCVCVRTHTDTHTHRLNLSLSSVYSSSTRLFQLREWHHHLFHMEIFPHISTNILYESVSCWSTSLCISLTKLSQCHICIIATAPQISLNTQSLFPPRVFILQLNRFFPKWSCFLPSCLLSTATAAEVEATVTNMTCKFPWGMGMTHQLGCIPGSPQSLGAPVNPDFHFLTVTLHLPQLVDSAGLSLYPGYCLSSSSRQASNIGHISVPS